MEGSVWEDWVLIEVSSGEPAFEGDLVFLKDLGLLWRQRVLQVAQVQQLVRFPETWLTVSAEKVVEFREVFDWMEKLSRVPGGAPGPKKALAFLCQFQFFLNLHADVIAAAVTCPVRDLLLRFLALRVFIPDAGAFVSDESSLETDKNIDLRLLLGEGKRIEIDFGFYDRKDVEEKLESSVVAFGPETLQDMLIRLSRLFLRDCLASGHDSPMNDILAELARNFIVDAVPGKSLSPRISPAKSLAMDLRANFLKQVESLTRDYKRILFRLHSTKHHYAEIRPISVDKTIQLIGLLDTSLKERGMTRIMSIDIESLVKKPLKERLDGIQGILIEKLSRRLIATLNVPISFAEGVSKAFQKSISHALVHVFCNPAFWLMILHRSIRIEMPEFPERSESEKSEGTVKDYALLGDIASSLIENLIDISNPTGVAGFVAQVGKHLVHSYSGNIGKSIVDEIVSPVSWKRVQWIMGFAEKILWEPKADGSGEIFLTDLSMFKKIVSDMDKGNAQDIREAVLLEITDFVFAKTSEMIPRNMSWMTTSVKSVRVAIWTLCSILFDITQSPLLLRFVVLQYLVLPLLSLEW